MKSSEGDLKQGVKQRSSGVSNDVRKIIYLKNIKNYEVEKVSKSLAKTFLFQGFHFSFHVQGNMKNISIENIVPVVFVIRMPSPSAAHRGGKPHHVGVVARIVVVADVDVGNVVVVVVVIVVVVVVVAVDVVDDVGGQGYGTNGKVEESKRGNSIFRGTLLLKHEN